MFSFFINRNNNSIHVMDYCKSLFNKLSWKFNKLIYIKYYDILRTYEMLTIFFFRIYLTLPWKESEYTFRLVNPSHYSFTEKNILGWKTIWSDIIQPKVVLLNPQSAPFSKGTRSGVCSHRWCLPFTIIPIPRICGMSWLESQDWKICTPGSPSLFVPCTLWQL